MNNGTGVELQLSTEKAQKQIDELLKKMQELQNTLKETMELKVKADTKPAEQQLTKLEKSMKWISQNVPSFTSAFSKSMNSLAGFSSDLTRWAGRTAQAVVGVFDKAVGGISNLASSGFEQLQTLENSLAGYKAFFSDQPGGFDQTAFKKKIIATANELPGLDTGGLADAIMQLAPLSSNSDQAFNASLGVIKALKYSGSDSSELGYVIRNLRDVVSKGAMNERDRQQFLRAIPALEKILISTGQTQFLDENGKLKSLPASEAESKELVAQLVGAFAKINDNPEVTKVFEEMQNSTQGTLEKFRQTMESSFLEAFETPGAGGKSLVDLLKDFLNDNNVNKFADVITKIGQKMADFLSTINFDEILDKLFDDAKELTEHIKTTLLPTIKSLLGMDENGSTTELIKKMMDFAKRFLKGMIDGFNTLLWFVDKIKGFLSSLGVDGDFASLLGGIAGFSKFGFKGISAVSNAIGSLTKMVGGLTTKGGTKLLKGANETLTAKAVNQLGKWTGRSGVATSLSLAGAGLTQIIGRLATNSLNELAKQNRESDKALQTGINTVGKAVTNGITGFLVTKSPIGALIGSLIGVAEGIGTSVDEWRKEQQEKKEANETNLREHISNIAINRLESQGLFKNGETRSSEAQDYMKQFLEQNYNFDNLTKPEDIAEAINKAMDAYLEYFSSDKFTNELSETITDWLNNPKKLQNTPLTTFEKDTGSEVLTPEAEQEYGDKIRQIYDVVSKYIVPGGNQAQEIDTVQEMYQYLKSNDLNVNSKEELEDLYNFVTGEGQEILNLYEKMGSSKIIPNVDDKDWLALKANIEGWFTSYGWEQDNDGKWYQEVSVKLVETAKEATGATSDNPTSKFIDTQVLRVQALNEAGAEGGWGAWWDEYLHMTRFKKAIEEAKKWQKNNSSGGGGWYTGGFIRPVRHFAGGGKPYGVDTVPAMLQPGEFVLRKSSVDQIGLHALYAMNQGDLMTAYRSIGADMFDKLNHSYDYSRRDDHSSHRRVFVKNVNHYYNRSGAKSGIYRSFRNIAALTR